MTRIIEIFLRCCDRGISNRRYATEQSSKRVIAAKSPEIRRLY